MSACRHRGCVGAGCAAVVGGAGPTADLRAGVGYRAAQTDGCTGDVLTRGAAGRVGRRCNRVSAQAGVAEGQHITGRRCRRRQIQLNAGAAVPDSGLVGHRTTDVEVDCVPFNPSFDDTRSAEIIAGYIKKVNCVRAKELRGC